MKATLALALLLLSAAAHAAPPRKQEAKQHFDRGNQLYREGDYTRAVEELNAGYALDPRPDFLYALGQAERKLGKCAEAVRYYGAYLASGPSQQGREAALLQIERCQQEQAAAAPEAAPAAPAPVATPVPRTPTPTTRSPAPAVVTGAVVTDAAPAPPARTPIYKRWWLWTAVVGVAAVGVGVGVGVALSQKPSFDPTLPDFVVGRAALGVRF